ncbi:AI-2E family transporter, partial [Clostridium saudiense]|nr:AI-2E family transporter [Clostridium saudiense]
MTIVKVVSGFVTTLGTKMLSFAGSIPGAIITVLVTLISTYFFTKEIENIQRGVKNIFSEKGHRLFSTVKGKMNSVFGGYIKAYLLIMIVIAFTSFIIFTLAKVSYALPIAVITAILDFLPLIGAGLVYGILAITMYISGSKTAAIILLIGYVI